jgi:hypothetical protein
MDLLLKEIAKDSGLMQTKWADRNASDVAVRIWQESLNNPGAMEQFALSIIDECIAVIRLAEEDISATDIARISEDIRKHFGVSE